MNSELSKRTLTSIIILIVSIFFLYQGHIFFGIFLIIIFILSFLEWIKLSINKISFFFGIFFLIVSFTTIYLLRSENLFFFIISILISVFSDIGGYVFGKILKGPKLTKISPNKTISGMIGSYIFSLIAVSFYFYTDEKFFQLNNEYSYNFNFLFIVLILSSINQLGDLIISYFKRKKNINDTGKILPGHGGILDRIDGMIFSVPTTYFIYKFFLWKKKLE